ncbi:MAG: VOC family protein [Bacteroidota bacterium]
MNPINWFEIPVTDMPRAISFYEAVLEFDLKLNELPGMQMAWFPNDPKASGATGCLMLAPTHYTPSHEGTLVYFSVKDIDAVLTRVPLHGGKVLQGKMALGGEHGFVAHFEDSEGNRVALHAVSG